MYSNYNKYNYDHTTAWAKSSQFNRLVMFIDQVVEMEDVSQMAQAVTERAIELHDEFVMEQNELNNRIHEDFVMNQINNPCQ